MCRRLGFKRGAPVPSLFLLCALLFPGPGVAQTALDSLRQAVDSELVRLAPAYADAWEAGRTADSLRRLRAQEEFQVPLDTFSVGPFRLAAEPRQRGMAEALFSSLLTEFGPMVSGSEDVIEPWTFLVRRAWGFEGIYPEGDSLLLVAAGREFRPSILRELAYNRIGLVLWHSLPGDTQNWIGAKALTLSPEREEWVARALATTPSFAVRRCYNGDLDWCRRALNLGDETASWDLWYNGPERRLAVSRMGKPVSDPRRAALWDGCVDFEQLTACDLFLSDEPVQIPLSRTARSSFLAWSLREGGEGSLARFRQSEVGTVEERLAEVAGVPVDTLLASWRRHTLSAQRSAWAGLAKTPLAILFWFVFFGFLATRSTRWRLG